jgi:DNA polymerase III subunit epsilon
MLRLTRPLVVFDIESTGKDPTTDRIVELALVTLKPLPPEEGVLPLFASVGVEQRTYEWRVNPEMPIPQEASAIHGISDDDVKDAPTFAMLAPVVAGLFAGADVSGFNARNYDIPLIECEFHRAGIMTSPLADARIVDTKEIFHAKEPRDLSAAVRFYCGETLEGAHGAKADAIAAMKVLFKQVERYPDIPRTIDGLADAFRPKELFVDPTRRLRVDLQGEVVINFGQHRGVRLIELAQKKRDYLEWILQGEWHPKVKDAVRQAFVTLERMRQGG